MREQWARRVALLTGVLLVAIAAALSGWHNRIPAQRAHVATTLPSAGREAATPAASIATASALAARGQAIYTAQGCARCHRVAGAGNPRSTLDAIGSRRDSVQLRQWITADPAIAASLSTRARAAKAEYARLPPADLDALVAYLQSL